VENGIGYGGAAICMRHLVRNLNRSLYYPYVVTGRTGPDYRAIADEAEWRHIADRHFDVVGMQETLAKARWPGRIPGLRFLLNQMVARLDDIGNFVPFFFSLLIFAWRNKIDLVHANNEPLCNRASLLVANLLRIPSVCHVRGDQTGSLMMGWTYRLPDHFLPVSHWVSESIGKLGIDDSKRTVVYDGLELDKLDTEADGGAFRRSWGVPADAFVIGLVGLLIPWKGQELFLDAAKLIRDRVHNLKMLIVGGTPEECGPYEAHLRQRVAEEGLDELVLFTGHVSNMPQVYNGLDVVVSASTSPEPLGTVVIECMVLGRPLVAPNHGGAAEMAEQDVSALLFEPSNAQSLADAFLRLYTDPSLGSRLGANAREKALRTFSVQQHVRAVQAVYDRCLQPSPPDIALDGG
jgi:glycosyltransferase involved in cell wall biosynthesis